MKDKVKHYYDCVSIYTPCGVDTRENTNWVHAQELVTCEDCKAAITAVKEKAK